MKTYDLGRFWVAPLTVAPRTPTISFSHTWEIEPPHRFARTVVVRTFPFIRGGIAFGWWQDTDIEDLETERQNRLSIEAANAAYDAYCAVNGEVQRDKWDEARRKIAEMNLDYEDEMAYMQNLGIFA